MSEKSRAPGSGARMGGIFIVDCYDKYGNFKWSDQGKNLVVKQGLQNMLDVTFTTGGTKQGTWYLGLTTTGPSVLGSHTMGAHTGWTESTKYAATTRPAWTETRSSQTLTNAAAKATFTVNANTSKFGGAILVSTKARKTTKGILMCGAAFSGGDKTGDSGDKLQVTYTFAAADDGA